MSDSVVEFLSTSGNSCRLRVIATAGRKLAVDAAWQVTPSDLDMCECNVWFAAKIPDMFPEVTMASVEGVLVEDPEKAATMVRDFMEGSS